MRLSKAEEGSLLASGANWVRKFFFRVKRARSSYYQKGSLQLSFSCLARFTHFLRSSFTFKLVLFFDVFSIPSLVYKLSFMRRTQTQVVARLKLIFRYVWKYFEFIWRYLGHFWIPLCLKSHILFPIHFKQKLAKYKLS